MFKSPASPVFVDQPPTIKGADSITMFRDLVTLAPAERFFIQSGGKIHLPGCAIDGSDVYYAGKKVRLNIYTIFTTGGTEYYYNIISALNTAPWSVGTDANGAYVILSGDYEFGSYTFGSPYVSGNWVLAMTYADNPYNVWPGPLPPAYYSASIVNL